jgi:hypothetical protein
MAFLTSPLAGVSLTTISDSPKVAVGTTALGNNATMWEYVKALSTIAQYDAVLIKNSGEAQPATTALGVSDKKIGFAQVAITSGYYGWVARTGDSSEISVTVLGNCAAGAQLYLTSTAGSLDDAVVTGGLIPGCFTGAITATSVARTAAVNLGCPGVVITAAPGS